MGHDMTYSLFLVTLVLVIYLLTTHLLRHVEWVHHSSLAIITGGILACATTQQLTFDNSLFFNLLLPMVIFSGGYRLGKTHFFSQLSSIVYLGLLGSLLMVFIMTGLVSLLSQYCGVPLSFSDTLLLACVLSSNDTVAALGLIKE